MGLTFDARKSFRGRVRVAFGEPIAVPPYLAAYHEDAVTAVDAMTTAIQWGMQAQVLHLERPDRTDVIRAVEDLYRSELVRELRAVEALELMGTAAARQVLETLAGGEAESRLVQDARVALQRMKK